MLKTLFISLFIVRAIVGALFLAFSLSVFGSDNAHEFNPLLTKYDNSGELPDSAKYWECVISWHVDPIVRVNTIDQSYALMHTVFEIIDSKDNYFMQATWEETDKFLMGINAIGFCGFKDWGHYPLMPANIKNTHDKDYFPTNATFWTSKEYAPDRTKAYIDGPGIDSTNNVRPKTELHATRFTRIFYKNRE